MSGSRQAKVIALLALAWTGCGLDLVLHQSPDAQTLAACDDGVRNGLETAVDCGGGCAPCTAGRACEQDSDCESAGCVEKTCAAPYELHPRLWITRADLPRLRAWATGANPVFQAGLGTLATRGIQWMDSPAPGTPGNLLPDGDNGFDTSSRDCEAYAAVFAFLSLVAPDEQARADYARRGKALLMHVIDRAALGAAPGEAFRDPRFPLGDRAERSGESFGLAVDWLYPVLSADEKARIRRVFLRWSEELAKAEPSPYPRPEAPRLENDPSLLDLADPRRAHLRGSLETEFLFRMRNLGLMALALDPADDVDDPELAGDDAGEYEASLRRAIGAWGYVADYALRTEATGGVPPEGFAAFASGVGHPLQLLLALHSAGLNGEEAAARQVPAARSFAENPFWGELLPAYLHSLSPTKVAGGELGLVYQPAWFGDASYYLLGDPIAAFGSLGAIGARTGREEWTEGARWVETHAPQGGEGKLLNRVGAVSRLTDAVLFFLLFDPDVAPATDPRPSLPTAHWSPGAGRLLARTSWDEDAALFAFRLGWNAGARQHGDGNSFAFFHGGQWLTKERSGRGYLAGSSDYANTLTIETEAASAGLGAIPAFHARRGAQFVMGAPRADPPAPVFSEGADWLYVRGDAAPLYDYDNGFVLIEQVELAERSIFWLKPATLVVYDRARTRSSGRPKRFWLTLPGPATESGTRVEASAPGGQRLAVTTLLPAAPAADRSIVETDPTLEEIQVFWAFADYDPMNLPYSYSGHPNVNGARRLRVEAVGHPAYAEFLHVLEAVASTGTATTSTLLVPSTGSGAGAVIGSRAVLLSTSGGEGELRYRVPVATTHHLVAGLTPGQGYAVLVEPAGEEREIVVAPGSGRVADAAGVLAFEL